jgi:hypothetical protein
MTSNGDGVELATMATASDQQLIATRRPRRSKRARRPTTDGRDSLAKSSEYGGVELIY